MAQSRREFIKLAASFSAATGVTGPLWAATGGSRVGVLVGHQAPELERFAASELCDYLNKLFGVEAQPTTRISPSFQALFLIGSPQTNLMVKRARGGEGFPKVSEQGIVLRRMEYEGKPALIVGGGSPAATLWAVYELVERWGVRYLTEGDVLPANVGEFKVPDLNVKMEPIFRVRAHPTIQDFAASGECWGIADFRRLIRQLAKLKFNRLNIYPFAWQPYLDWQCRDIKRRSAWLWYGYHYPIRPGMPGQDLFGNASEFWNPDLPITSNYKELVEAGERQIHSLINEVHRHGMKCAIAASLTDFPPEFAPLLKGEVVTNQLGGLTVAPGPETPLDDPGLFDLASAALRATINTYPETDYITVYMPEFRQWTGEYERAWSALDKKYGINKVVSLDEVLNRARNRKGGTWSPERAVSQVKGDIASLYFYEKLLRNSSILEGTRNPHAKFMYWGVTEELFPILDRVLPHGWELGSMPDNYPARLLERREIISELPAREIPAVMDLTIDDDNIGIVPHITTDSLYPIVQDMQRYGWAGFTARERFPGDHDSTLAYLARAAWDRNATPAAVIRDQLQVVCGNECAKDLLETFHQIEQVTTIFINSDAAFAFPADWPPSTASSPGGMLLKYWKYRNNGPLPEYLAKIRSGYQQALEAAQRALLKSRPQGRKQVEFWVGRLKFAVGYVGAVEAVAQASIAEASKNHSEALQQLDKGVEKMYRAIAAYAEVARNPSDRGAIAVANEYGYHALKVFAWHMRAWGY